MTDNFKVTVYITNFNYGKYIEQAIQSVLNQSYKNIEILIIDDGSTDNSKEIISKFASDPKITTLFKKNEGLIAACNTALYNATGNFIIRLDADDWLDENIISIMVDHFKNDSALELIFPDYYEVDKAGNITNIFRRHDFKDVNLHDQSAHGACTMFKTRTLIESGGYDEYFSCQDGVDVWLRYVKKYKVKNINTPLFYYRMHENNLTKKEGAIIDNRHKILKKNNNERDIHCIAVIPVRGKEYDINSIDMELIENKPVIEWTIDNLLKSNELKSVIVSTPDKQIIKHIKSKYDNRVLCFNRDKKFANTNVILDRSIREVIRKYEKLSSEKVDATVIIKTRCPFMNYKHIENAINSLQIFNLDMVTGVKLENKIFYTHNGKTMRPLRRIDLDQIRAENELIGIKIESEQIYLEAGNFIVTSDPLNMTENFQEAKIGHEILDELSSFQIKTKMDFDISKFLASKFLSNV